MIGLASLVLLDQLLNLIRTEIIPVSCGLSEQNVVCQLAQLVAKPAVEGYAKAHFGSIPDGLGEQFSKRFSQQPLAPAPAELQTDRQRRSKFDEPIIEERLTHLE